MKVEKLVRMANQIAINFDYGAGQDKVVASVADHIKRFWTPEMRTEIVERASAGDIGLNEAAAAAVAEIARHRTDAA